MAFKMSEFIIKLVEAGVPADKLGLIVDYFEREYLTPAKDADRVRAQRYRDNRRKNGLSTYFKAEKFWGSLVKRDGPQCVYCGSEPGVAIDHMMPISKGGTDDLDNLALACRPCNSGKAGRDPNEARMTFASESAEISFNRYLAAFSRADGARQIANDIDGGDSRLSLTTSISSSEVKGNAKEVSKKGRKRSNKIPLPEDFAPTDAHYAKAASLGCSPAFVLSKFEDLKNWALSNDVRKADWSATLHGFIRRDAEKGLQHGQPNYGQTLRTAVSQLKSGGVTAIQPAGSGTGARPALRLISAGEGDQP